MAQPEPQHRSHAGIVVLLAILAVAATLTVLLVTGVITVPSLSKPSAEPDAKASVEPIPVRVSLKTNGLDFNGGSKVPVSITDASSQTQTQYVDANGDGLAVTPGSYEVSVAAPPILSDGSIPAAPTQAYQLEVERGATEADASQAGEITFEFQPRDAADVPDDEAQQALQYARDGGCESPDEADQLYQTWQTTHDQQIQERAGSAADEQPQAADTVNPQLGDKSVTYQGVTFTYPDYWVGKVIAMPDDAGMAVVPDFLPTAPLVSFRPATNEPISDMEAAASGELSLPDGSTAVICPWDDGMTFAIVTSPSGSTYIVEANSYVDTLEMGITASQQQQVNDLQTGYGEQTSQFGTDAGIIAVETSLQHMTFA